MLPQEIIRKKRDGHVLTPADIEDVVRGITTESMSEGQVAAFAMAVFFKGMSRDEAVALTRAMTASGTTIDWRSADLDGPVLDKHSTGGVGDKVSLMLAPMVAACGGYVPMISGRGLGHTGGTLDKLDSIPGYDTAPDLDTFRAVIADAGCAVIGQTSDLAPADRRLYGIRDVTATVESVPLITASILSKKLAAGLDGLVMDVKWGNGAFAANMGMAEELAESIVCVAEGANLPCVALITDMNQILGGSAGNALEIGETVRYLTGAMRDPRLHDVTMALAAEMLVLGKLAADVTDARGKLQSVLDSGHAAERFQRMVSALGGPKDLIDNPMAHLPRAPVKRAVMPLEQGCVKAIDTRAAGLAVVTLGGGRRRATDTIDYAVGFDRVAGIGDMVGQMRPLAIVHARDEETAIEASEALREAFIVGETSEVSPPIVKRFSIKDFV